jgi:predicted Na+-dependent transporter
LMLGLSFPQTLSTFAPYVTVMLGGIFFLAALTISVKDIRAYASDFTLVGVVVFLMLVAFPIGVFYAVEALYPPLALPLFLLAAMPTGMTAPLLTELAGGKRSLALVLTVTTSVLAPFSIPLLAELLLGSSVSVDVWGMFRNLLIIIGVPFLLAHLLRGVAPRVAQYVGKRNRLPSIFLLGFLVASIVAGQAHILLGGLDALYVAGVLGALIVVFVLLHILGYILVFWRSKEERIAISVCITYMNFTLALYVANTFFPQENAVVPIMLAIVPWTLMINAFRIVAQARKGV